MHKSVVGLLLLSLFTQSPAQNAPIKFGKPDLADLQMTTYTGDSSASAVILCDFGESWIDYIGGEFQVIFERTIRIKILSKEGLSWGDHEISYYDPEVGDDEDVSGIKGFTFNLEKGKMVKTKLEKDGIFDSESNEYWSSKKVTFPQVREGSVIDLTYKITSPYLFNYRDWQFQHAIPVKWSEYRAKFIEYYKYEQLMQGYLAVTHSEKKRLTQSFSIKTKGSNTTTGNITTRTQGELNTYTAQADQYQWIIENVPAFKKEKHMSSMENYVSKIDFQLVGEMWPGRAYKNLLGDWEKINERYSKADFFYGKVKGSNFLKSEIDAVLSSIADASDLDKAAAIKNHIGSKVRWNGYNARSASSPLRSVFSDGTGTVAEINLMLTSALQKAGIDAEPVLISTRNNGFVRTQYPIIDQFNYVICRAIIDDNVYLIDATDPVLPIGALPQRCLNGKGLVITPAGHSWVSLDPVMKSKNQMAISLQLQDEKMIGQLTHKFDGYEAGNIKKAYFRDSTEFVNEFTAKYGWEMTRTDWNDISSESVPVLEADFSLELESAGQVIYLNAILQPLWQEHPFKLENRTYPVDFSAPISKTYYQTLEVPEGYIVEELPKPTAVALPNNGGVLRFTVNKVGNKISVLCQVDIDQIMFPPNEYPIIKGFFDLIMAAQDQVIVLKKT